MLINNIFGEIPEQNITFVVDTSGSMYDVLSVVKDHITEVLMDRAYNRLGTTFNIIEFSSDITQWADRMVECTPITANAATRWLRGIESQTGSDTLTALHMAFDEPRCQAVYLVTDGMPDQNPEEIIHRITKASYGRPVHCIAVSTGVGDLPLSSTTFLENLAIETRGSFHVVQVGRLGDVNKVNSIYNSVYTPIEGSKKCSVETSLTHNPYTNLLSTLPAQSPPFVPFYRYNPPLHTEVFKEALERTPVASIVVRGTRILARRDEDGYYYGGSVAQEITGDRTKFLVEFDRTKKGRDLRMQETYLHDIIAWNDALRHSVVAEDHVLAPWEEGGKRYGPGKVVSGTERRHTIGDYKDSNVVVAFWNGKTVTVEKGVSVWIPKLLYDRILVELQMPITARKEIIDSSDASDLPPGYPSLPIGADDVIRAQPWDPLVSIRRNILYHPWFHNGMYYLPTYPLLTPVARHLQSWHELILTRPDLLYGSWPWPFYPKNVLPYRRRYPVTQPTLEGSSLTKEELRDIVDRQLDEHDLLREPRTNSPMLSSDSDSELDENDYADTVATWPLMVDKGTNTGKSYLRRSKMDKPEWKKYWPQTPQPRNHHQPNFHQRPTGMFSTWEDPDFGSHNGINNSSMFDEVGGYGIKSDRKKLLRHLETPYVERPEQAGYVPRVGSTDGHLHRYNDRIQDLHRRSASARDAEYRNKNYEVLRRAQTIEDTKRQQAIQRIGSDVEKQRQYEQKLRNTIDAKAKINQNFRDRFFQKELDHINRQESHSQWLQHRRDKFTKDHLQKLDNRDRMQESRAIGRQYRQMRHHNATVRRTLVEDARVASATLGSA
ncbi:uncharacterized protein LOC100181394 [Ciona intestinalis]